MQSNESPAPSSFPTEIYKHIWNALISPCYGIRSEIKAKYQIHMETVITVRQLP